MLKSFDSARDIVNQLSTVNEVVVFSAAILTGSATNTGELNIKRFNHWVSGSSSGSFYHALYNQNFTSSLAVELANVTFGYSHSSSFFVSRSFQGTEFGHATNALEKNRIYRLFAKQLLGDDEKFFEIDGQNRHELIFIALRRSQYKDEIKKGTVSLRMMFSGTGNGAGPLLGARENSVFDERIFTDEDAISQFERSERGDVANLTTGSIVGGRIFYQAGVLVGVPEIISNTSSVDDNVGNAWSGSSADAYSYGNLVVSGGLSGTLDNLLDGIRYRILNLSIVNQSNLHSTFYFCRALNDEFNYSSNPTFIDAGGRIIVTSGSTDLSTRTYITKVGLLGENSETLAVASLSQPLKKTPDSELLIKVRLDY